MIQIRRAQLLLQKERKEKKPQRILRSMIPKVKKVDQQANIRIQTMLQDQLLNQARK